MKFRVGLLAATLVLIVVVAYLHPVTNDLLFQEPEKGNPLGYLKNLPEPRTPAPPAPSSTTGKAAPSLSENQGEPVEETVPSNQVSNGEVSRILLQILAARKLADGISLSVTDREIIVYGNVTSEEDLDRIVDILDRGRESRTINLQFVTRANEVQ